MKNYILFIVVAFACFSCEPRVEIDYDQWGDQAFIQNVQIFGQEVKDDFQMAEYYENGDLTTGVRRIILNGATVVIDKENFVVSITIPAGNDLSETGFLITHTSTLVEPIDEAPKAGIVSNLSVGTDYHYRLHSADGTTHDWTVVIEEI